MNKFFTLIIVVISLCIGALSSIYIGALHNWLQTLVGTVEWTDIVALTLAALTAIGILKLGKIFPKWALITGRGVGKFLAWCWHNKSWAINRWKFLLPPLMILLLIVLTVVIGIFTAPFRLELIVWPSFFGLAGIISLLIYWAYKQNWALWSGIGILCFAGLPLAIYYGKAGATTLGISWIYVVGTLCALFIGAVSYFRRRHPAAAPTTGTPATTSRPQGVGSIIFTALAWSGASLVLTYILGRLMRLPLQEILITTAVTCSIIFVFLLIIVALNKPDLKKVRNWVVALLVIANLINLAEVAGTKELARKKQIPVIPHTAKVWVMALEEYDPESLRPSPWHNFSPPQPAAVVEWNTNRIEIKRSYVLRNRPVTTTFVWDRVANPLYGTYSGPDHNGTWRMWPAGKDKFNGELVTTNPRGEQITINMWIATSYGQPL